MRLLFTLCLVILSTHSYCQYYSGQILYTSEKKMDAEIKFPIQKEAQNIEIKSVEDQSKIIPANEIKYIIIKLNGEEEYVIKRGMEIKFSTSGSIEYQSKKSQWSMIEKVYDHLIISQYAKEYTVKKVNGKDTMLTYFSNNDTGYYISKYEDDKLFHLKKVTPRFIEKNLKKGQHFLFEKCPDYISNIVIKDFVSDNPFFELVQRYEQCILIQKENAEDLQP